MTKWFEMHLERCTPLYPCINCQGIALIRKHTDAHGLECVLDLFRDCDNDTVAEIFESHSSTGCSPAAPCKHCECHSFLSRIFSKRSAGMIDFAQFSNIFLFKDYVETEAQLSQDELFRQKIVILNFSKKVTRLLSNNRIVYIGDLCQHYEPEMLRISTLGRKSLDEIKLALSKRGLRLGMDISNWPPEGLIH